MSRITFAQIEAFYWIARLGTFREAARQLNVSQPTISLRIRDLERVLGRDCSSAWGAVSASAMTVPCSSSTRQTCSAQPVTYERRMSLAWHDRRL